MIHVTRLAYLAHITAPQPLTFATWKKIPSTATSFFFFFRFFLLFYFCSKLFFFRCWLKLCMMNNHIIILYLRARWFDLIWFSLDGHEIPTYHSHGTNWKAHLISFSSPGFWKWLKRLVGFGTFFLGLGGFDIRLGRDNGKLVIGGKMKWWIITQLHIVE